MNFLLALLLPFPNWKSNECLSIFILLTNYAIKWKFISSIKHYNASILYILYIFYQKFDRYYPFITITFDN